MYWKLNLKMNVKEVHKVEIKLEKALNIIETERDNYTKLSKLIEYFKSHDVMAEKIADELDFNSSICDILNTSQDTAYRYSQLLQEKLKEINVSI